MNKIRVEVTNGVVCLHLAPGWITGNESEMKEAACALIYELYGDVFKIDAEGTFAEVNDDSTFICDYRAFVKHRSEIESETESLRNENFRLRNDLEAQTKLVVEKIKELQIIRGEITEPYEAMLAENKRLQTEIDAIQKSSIRRIVELTGKVDDLQNWPKRVIEWKPIDKSAIPADRAVMVGMENLGGEIVYKTIAFFSPHRNCWMFNVGRDVCVPFDPTHYAEI